MYLVPQEARSKYTRIIKSKNKLSTDEHRYLKAWKRFICRLKLFFICVYLRSFAEKSKSFFFFPDGHRVDKESLLKVNESPFKLSLTHRTKIAK